MKAAVLNQIPGDLIIEDISIDKPEANEVLVQVVNAGLCHSLRMLIGIRKIILSSSFERFRNAHKPFKVAFLIGS